MKLRIFINLLVVAVVAALTPAPALGARHPDTPPPDEALAPHREGELLVGFPRGTSEAHRRTVHGRQQASTLKSFEEIGVDLVRLPPGQTVSAARRNYEQERAVLYAEPNYLRRHDGVTPNDPSFGNQWGLRNIGQTVNSDTGTADADIDASEAGGTADAWSVQTGTTAPIVAVIDTGIDITHPDLAANIWVNTSEVPGNGVDDDGNGYVDDRNGWDFANNDSSVYDPNESCGGGDRNDDHGTHVAGIAGAVGNNGTGVSGVNWRVRIMPLKFLTKGFGLCGIGDDADAIEAILYAADKGADVINASWGGGPSNNALRQAFIAAGEGGILFAVAAGNAASDLSDNPDFPPSWDLENEIIVASSTNDDNRSSFSNFGGPTDLAAPGSSILSTITGGNNDFFSGTSMATPFVSGAVALLRAQYPNATAAELKDRILSTVDAKAAFASPITQTGGRLNLNKAIRDVRSVVPTVLSPNGGQTFTGGSSQTISWNNHVPSGNPLSSYRAEFTSNALASTTFSTGFESGMPSGFSEAADSEAPWTINSTSPHAGSFAARSGTIANEEGSWLSTTRRLSVAGQVSFWYRTSSENCETPSEPVCGDYLRFYIDGAQELEKAGVIGWTQETFSVPAGTHTFSWSYQKDPLCPGDSGCPPPTDDAVWIDDVSITGIDNASWSLVGTTSSGATSLNWTVPSIDTSSAKVRVCRDTGGACNPSESDESDSVFTIDTPTPGVVVTQSGGSTNVTEGGASDSYTVVLATQPSSNVTISISVGSQVTTNVPSLVFTPENWSTPQTVNVSAVNDSVDEASPHFATITHSASSSDPSYNGISIASVVVSITDNDGAGVVITQSGGSTNVTEGGAGDSYTVVLTSQPTSNVTISINDGPQLNASPTSLLFTSSNWSTPQTVNVSAVDDSLAEGPHTGTITHSASSSDGFYNGISISSITASITDNEAAVTISQSGGSTNVTEGGATDSYTVVLATPPASDVTISINDGPQLNTSPSSLVFTSSNWSTPQTVIVSAVNDSVDETTPHVVTITHSATSSDAAYNGITIPSVSVSITDNDTAAVVITQTGGTTAVTEGGAGDSYTVVLATQPTSNVTISINEGPQLNASPTSLLFTTSNWSTPQTVSVSAVDDSLAEGPHTGTITHSATSSDSFYSGISISSITASITDNEAAVTISQSGGSTNVAEGGATDSYTVVLATQPTSNVTISINDGSQLSASPASLLFTNSNWSTPQTVVVSALDDSVDEVTPHLGTITHSAASSDAAYNGITIPSVSVSITDNDGAGVLITQSGGTTAVTEGGTGDSYSVVLATQPTSNVTVSINDGPQLNASPTSLLFTNSNWSTPQTVNVSAVDDSLAEGPHTGTITHSATSSDSFYSGISISSITASITDNETKGVLITQTGGTTDVAEGGATDTYSVVLLSQPTSNVTVSISPDSQVTVSSPSLTFTPSNWSVPQNVTVGAVNDDDDEPSPHPGVISHSASSSDPTYGGIPIVQVTANIQDDDEPVSVIQVVPEGATHSGFTTFILIANPSSTTESVVRITFLTPGGPVSPASVQEIHVGPRRRTTVDANTVLGFGADISTLIETIQGPAAVAEVSMHKSGSLATVDMIASDTPGSSWIMPEGATHSGFTTFVTVANPELTPATVDVTFLTGTYGTLIGPQNVLLAPRSRMTVDVGSALSGIQDDVSTKITTDSGKVVAGMSLHKASGGDLAIGGSLGVASAQTTWVVAEGATHSGFTTFVLIANPSLVLPAVIDVTFLTGGGPLPGPQSREIPPGRRITIAANDFAPESDVSTLVHATSGSVAVESSIHKGGPAGFVIADSVASGGDSITSASGTDWLAVEGAAHSGFTTFILLANPDFLNPAVVDVTFLTGSGPRFGPQNLFIAPGSRRTIAINDFVPGADSSTLVHAEAGRVVVEMAIDRAVAGIGFSKGSSLAHRLT